jgi:hypothetical protein
MASEINEQTAGHDAGDEEPSGGVSGKLVIIAIFVAAVSAAAASWLFRYNATHRAAEFWGPEAAQLIRDAKTVEFTRLNPPPDSTFHLDREFPGTLAIVGPEDVRDISTANGLTHLRTALLEDRSYRWPAGSAPPEIRWAWTMTFRGASTKDDAILLFSADCRYIAMFNRAEVLSAEPIAAGLRKIFAEMSASQPVASPAAQR